MIQITFINNLYFASKYFPLRISNYNIKRTKKCYSPHEMKAQKSPHVVVNSLLLKKLQKALISKFEPLKNEMPTLHIHSPRGCRLKDSFSTLQEK